jgi:hypothetical protein
MKIYVRIILNLLKEFFSIDIKNPNGLNIIYTKKGKEKFYKKNGLFNGEYKKYNKGGDIIFQTNYLDGKLHGELIEYVRLYCHDIIYKKENYINGIKDGKCRYFEKSSSYGSGMSGSLVVRYNEKDYRENKQIGEVKLFEKTYSPIY